MEFGSQSSNEFGMDLTELSWTTDNDEESRSRPENNEIIHYVVDNDSDGSSDEEVQGSQNSGDSDEDIEEDTMVFNSFNLSTFKCCKLLCMSKLTRQQIVLAYYYFTHNNVTSQEKRQHLQHTIFANSAGGEAKLVVCGNELCTLAWAEIHSVSHRVIVSAVENYRKGRVNARLRYRPKRRKIFTEKCIAFLTDYFSKVAEIDPEAGTRYLPSFLTKIMVYEKYRNMYQGKKIVTDKHFYRIWIEEFPNVKIPKEDRFSKCSYCCGLLDEHAGANDPAHIQSCIDALKAHNAFQMRERQAYRNRACFAELHPHLAMSIILDGMDQHKARLPKFARPRKELGFFIPTHLTRVLVHGETALGLVDVGQFKHDANLVINCIIRTLLHVDRIPEVLYIQADNCWRENKNKFVFAFLSYLVNVGVVKEIVLSFLMVGHTHEDIDQTFSVLSRQELSGQNVITLPAFCEKYAKVLESHEGRIKATVQIIDYMYDFHSWLEPYIRRGIEQHTYFYQYRFLANETGVCVMHYKDWSASPNWRPPQGIIILNDFPDTDPLLLEPAANKNLDLTTAATCIDKMLTCGTVRCFTDQDKNWWRNFAQHQMGLLYGTVYPITRPPHFDLDILLAKRFRLPLRPLDLSNFDEFVEAQNSRESLDSGIEIRYTGQDFTDIVDDVRPSLSTNTLMAIALTSMRCPIIVSFVKLNDDDDTLIEALELRGNWSDSFQQTQRKVVFHYKSVVLSHFSLTTKNRLKEKTRRRLKTEYRKLHYRV